MQADQAAVPFYVGGERVPMGGDLAVFGKGDGRLLARVSRANREAVDAALRLGSEARGALAGLPAWRRRDALLHVARRLGEEREAEARTLAQEAGKALKDARAEVERAIDTFTLAAGEATRIGGEFLPLDGSARGEGLEAWVRRFPIGLASFITPFNFPLNLVAHKVAPALAAGCPFALKPASSTPLSALRIGDFLAETDLPRGSFSVLPTGHREASLLVEDPRPSFLSFTGSADVGWELRRRAGTKRVTLELGGNAACIVDADADVEFAAQRLAAGAYSQAGQSCISVQRILVHRSRLDALRDALVARTAALVVGDPLDETTDIGPLIDEGEARRVEQWIAEAVEAGARLLVGGERRGAFLTPALLENVPERASLECREVFGPVATLAAFDDFEAALERVNASPFGLQAGIFTGRLEHALAAFERLEVGGVVVGDVPTTRADAMPYGGVKASGLGREGVRFAIEELTERRTLLLRRG